VTTWIRWLICAWVLAIGLGAAPVQPRPVWQDEWLNQLNRERVRAGLPPLRPSVVLSQVAQQQAEEMARRRRLQSPPADVVSARLRQVGYSAYDWREDYAVSPPVPEDVLLTMRQKAGSPVALDGRYRDLGVGTAVANGSTFHVLLFGWHQGDYFASATAQLADRPRVASEMLTRINEMRRRSGLRPFAQSPLLDRVSQEHAEDMLRRSYSGHWTPEGLGPSDRARASGYPAGIGENIVEQRFSVDEALTAWLESPKHRRNLFDPDSREMGLGLAVGAGYEAAPGGFRVIWVQSLGRGD
jgi:uncharacterized protein YkwD